MGFRPFVYTLARSLDVRGSVTNFGARVAIDAEGHPDRIAAFIRRLRDDAPEGSRIEAVDVVDREATNPSSFEIAESPKDRVPEPFISPDRATCARCLKEHDDPKDRRAGYPFLSCASCGPRLSMVHEPPYDRARTSMAAFPLCDACRGEYDDPADRRFHAEGYACERCGPSLSFATATETVRGNRASIDRAIAALLRGAVGAIKGLGGYHLACDATHAEAVARIRSVKARDDKPFAVCVDSVERARTLCSISEAEKELLEAAEAPVLLLSRRGDAPVAEAVAPRSAHLGVMLAYTPLHLELTRGAGRPLVLTSANVTDEPMATEPAVARDRLRDVADFFLDHDREIVVRVDDSVARVAAGAPVVSRLGRGYAPASFALGRHVAEPVFAAGGDYKSAFAFALGSRAVVGHHIGELERPACLEEYEKSVRHYERLLGVAPEIVAHDLHPDFQSTRFAERRAAAGARLVPVQHHHAHFAATLTEHGHEGPALGAIFDGIGLGTDGAAWGGEFFVGTVAHLRRIAHLRYVPMPGGDRASREGYRMAVAHLLDAETWQSPLARAALEAAAPGVDLATIAKMATRRINAPLTSSMGRLFDAVACLAGVRAVSGYEGQAAIELEWAALREAAAAPYPFWLDTTSSPATVDTRPLVEAVVRDVVDHIAPSRIARRFHETVAQIVADVAAWASAEHGLRTIAVGGGVFVNALVLEGCASRLDALGMRLLRPSRVPPGDGGLCLGQLAVAAASLHG